MLQQLIDSNANVDFCGGLDVRLMTEEKATMIRNVKVKMIHFAWDRYDDMNLIVPRIRMFNSITGFDRHKVMVYVLCNFDTTFEQDIERIYTLRDLDCQPYVMLYNKESIPKGHRLRRLQRWCNSPVIFNKVPRFDEYEA